MPDIELNIGGTWKSIDSGEVNIGGVWKDLSSVEVNIGGVWKTAWSALTYNLSGSSGSPVAVSYEASDPDDSEIVWLISGAASGSIVKGEIQSSGHDKGDAASYTSANPTTDFRVPKAGWTTLYVRLTLDAGDAPDSSTHAVDGSTWHTLTEDSNNIWWIYEHLAVPGSSTGTVQVEIDTVGDGSNIVASGFYKATCTVGI